MDKGVRARVEEQEDGVERSIFRVVVFGLGPDVSGRD